MRLQHGFAPNMKDCRSAAVEKTIVSKHIKKQDCCCSNFYLQGAIIYIYIIENI
jgi:hypothetical protein